MNWTEFSKRQGFNRFFTRTSGAAASISGIGSIIVYWTAKKIVEKFGAPTTVAVSLILTCLRFSAYYFFK